MTVRVDSLRKAWHATADAILLCEQAVDSGLDDRLREQEQRALDLLRDAADSLQYVMVNVEDEE